MATSEKEGIVDALVDALAPSQFFAGEYRVSTKWIRRFAISQGIMPIKISRESLYPRAKLLAALAAIEPGRLEAIQNRFSSSSCRPKELLVPEGFAVAKDSQSSIRLSA